LAALAFPEVIFRPCFLAISELVFKYILGGIMETITKRDKSLGKLNRTVAEAVDVLVAMGHLKKRFRRDYESGTASYHCPSCGATAKVIACQGHGDSYSEGIALVESCEAYSEMRDTYLQEEEALEMAA